MLNLFNLITGVGLVIQPISLSTQSYLKEAVEDLQNVSSSLITSAASSVMTFTSTDATMVSGVMKYLTAPVGFVLMVMYFMVAFLNQYKEGHDWTIDDIARPVFFLVVADLALSNIGPIIGALMSISNMGGSYFIENLADIIPDYTSEDGSFASAEVSTSGLSIIALVMEWVASLFGSVVSVVASLIVFIVLYTAKMELLLRFSFSPIGLSTLADETQKQEAFRYTKKLVASAFYFLGIVVILYYSTHAISGELMGIIEENTSDNPFIAVFLSLESIIFTAGVPFAAIGMVSVAKNVVNESFGV